MSSVVSKIRVASHVRPTADAARALAYDLVVELDDWLHRGAPTSRVARRIERFNKEARGALAELDDTAWRRAPWLVGRVDLDRLICTSWPTDHLVRSLDRMVAPARELTERIRQAVADVHESEFTLSDWQHHPLYSTLEINLGKKSAR